MVPHGEDALKKKLLQAEKFHFYNFSLAACIFLYDFALPSTC